MPRIFDNIEASLLPALRETLELSDHADFCVGYFNLRGWKELDSYIETWSGNEGHCCRLLVGMQKLPQDELREVMRLSRAYSGMDNQTAIRLKKKLAEDFRDQLMVGAPTNEDEIGLRRLAAQIKAKKVVVKLFLRHPLHAKLYLLFRPDPVNPATGYLGSSNLTFSGLSSQGELNIDVLDHDACKKLSQWFNDRWNDRWCIDISDELVRIIDESWAREEPIPPYHIYIKMAYHLSQEARTGLSEFRIPKEFGQRLFEFQKAAVKIAAHHINKRGGVLIGDVVGLGKTLMATAVARILEDDLGLETLIICPKNLVDMWKDYRDQYRLRARVLSIGQVISQLPDLRRFRLVLIDESHNLRNREGKRYHAIQEYISENESKVILLSATPYNKTYLDLSNQLRLFVPEDKELSIRPEHLLRDNDKTQLVAKLQCSLRSLAAFEKSEYADDWRELMRLFLVRRTRSFIQDNYAETDPENGRNYLTFEDGTRSYFPVRVPNTVKFKIDDINLDDQYAKLYASGVVDTINNLRLPRYGLGNYVKESHLKPPTQSEVKALNDLSRAGKRLMGFCRTNIFKRLESSGQAFILSIERHILRNYIFLHAIEQGQAIPIGAQDTGLLDARINDEDADATSITSTLFENEDNTGEKEIDDRGALKFVEDYKKRAAEIYAKYASEYKSHFRWLRVELFSKALAKDLQSDGGALFEILNKCGDWDSTKDTKLQALHKMIVEKHPHEKIIVFTQFADTVRYLEVNLKSRGVSRLSGVTGDSPDPTALAWRFSPESNEKRGRIKPHEELRVLIATDVLSEGQNLQDCFIVVNYDLPWAIIRLIQRAGRVDRIGQKAESILCYSFLPADGVERIIRLRDRVRIRLLENAEVVGTDEAFFEDDHNDQAVVDLYNEKAGIMDGDDDTEVDLASYAYQIWKNAVDADPKLKKIIPDMPSVVYSAKELESESTNPEGVLLYMRTGEGNDALAWIDQKGASVTESQFEILKAAKCSPDKAAIPRHEKHHELVKKGVDLLIEEERHVGGQLGRPSGARFRTYERLKDYAGEVEGTLFESRDLLRAIDDIYRYPLRQSAIDTLNRQLRSGISNMALAQLVIALREEDRLCLVHEEDRESQDPKIICSLGLGRKNR
jgi:superfamily II DNA or RNA helicase